MQMTRFEELKNLLSKPKQIVILSHRNPDGDAIGSSLAMNHYLTRLGHKCDMIVPNEFPKFLKWMDGAKDIQIAEYSPSNSRNLVENAELIFILDFNTTSRIDEVGQWVEKSTAPKVMIDHHQQPQEFDFMYSDTEIPAACQMIYNFIEAMGHLDLIDRSIGECIYTGIMTDTGNFRFKNTSAATHRIVAELMDKGVEADRVYNHIFNTQSPDRLRLLGKVLGSIRILPEYRTAFMYLTRKQQLKYNTQKGDTEGFVNYGLGIDNFIFSVIFIEDMQKNFYKISFRSKGNFDVNEFARKYFNGGGHINAAGGRSDLTLKETLDKFEKLLEQHKEELNKAE
ncbi:MAG: bifunctional oligoribonuclease/PAP phosphatase NrnA [Flavobacteriia bacterium]|nr:bifunctional oligoribonuclease/PAP phosphatase NrnA [Flavobacteriia bacterium]